MTLSLDDVRNKRFRMARKSGYEVLEVDEFVDEVEVAFEQLAEENDNLKKQIEALKASPAVDQAAPAEAGPTEPETIVVTTGAEASSAVVRLVSLSTEQAERLVDEATAEAAEIRETANAAAQEVTGDAQAQRVTGVHLHVLQIALGGEGGDHGQLAGAIIQLAAPPDIAQCVLGDALGEKRIVLAQRFEHGLPGAA